MMKKALYAILLCSIYTLHATDDHISIQDLIDRDEITTIKKNCGARTLDLSNRSISDLNGLLNIPGMQKVNILYLNNNNITQLPTNLFNQLPQLQYIYLAHNQIASIKGAFNRSPKLEGFDLSHNKLTKLERDSFNKEMPDEHFYIFDFSHNEISEIEKGTFKVELGEGGEINLSHNKIKNLHPIFKGLTSAGDANINVSHNHIRFGENAPNPFSKHLYMEELNLSHNKIDNDMIIYLLLQRAKNNYTTMTYVSHNKIKLMHSDTIKKLKNIGLHEDDMEFDISHNKLSPKTIKRIVNTINAIKKGLKDKGASLNFICQPQQAPDIQAASSSASMHDDNEIAGLETQMASLVVAGSSSSTNNNQVISLSGQLKDRLFL